MTARKQSKNKKNNVWDLTERHVRGKERKGRETKRGEIDKCPDDKIKEIEERRGK